MEDKNNYIMGIFNISLSIELHNCDDEALLSFLIGKWPESILYAAEIPQIQNVF